MINAINLTHKYKSDKGVFDLNFSLKKGSVTGYLGPNGAGKSTTIRLLMGFIKSQLGSCSINGLDCFKSSEEIKKSLGYIPGEIAFSNNIKCEEFIKYQQKLRGLKDLRVAKELIDRFSLDTSGNIKTFSKGMKQKLAIILAFMHEPDVLILDEPTSGLDPLVQNEFIHLLKEEKEKGKTILMSSHIFEEVEKSCDDVIIIKEGKIVNSSDISDIKSSLKKSYTVKCTEPHRLKEFGYDTKILSGDTCEIYVGREKTDEFIKKLATLNVLSLDIKEQSLEELFLNYYKEEKL